MKKLLFTILSVLCISVITHAQDIDKNKALYNAIVNDSLAEVTKLLNEGADANYVIIDANQGTKISMLIAAVKKKNLAMVKALVEHKADVNFRDASDSQAIIYAAAAGSKDMVEFLYTNGGDIRSENADGENVLSSAKESGNAALINYVKQKVPWKE